MNATEELSQQINDLEPVPSSDRDGSIQNETETNIKSDTPLTQECSPIVLDFDLPPLPFDPEAVRGFIFTDREAVGRLTPLGRHYSKFGEQTDNFLKAKNLEQALRLAVEMIDTHKAIKQMRRVRVAAPSLALAGG